MADQNPTGTAAAEPSDTTLDLRAQLAVLELVVDNSPVHLTVADVMRAMDASDFQERDRVERAIRDLYDIGLILRCGDALAPTRAAVHVERLEKAR